MSDRPDFARFLNIRSSYGGTLRHDGQRLAFINTTTGTGQIWTLDRPQGWPEQRTFYPERITFASYSPVDNRLVFGKDEGGNELDQLFLMDDEGLEVQALTDMPAAKHVWGGWSPDGTRIAFTATRDNPAEFYPYVLDIATGAIRLVAELPGYNTISAWLPDGQSVILSRHNGNTDTDLFLLDLASGAARQLTPDDSERYEAPRVTPDGTTLYLLSDRGREFLNLAQLDIATGAMSFVDEHSWDREGLALTKDGRWLALASNEDGYGVVEVRDLANGSGRRVKGLPAGVVAGPGRSAAGDTFLLTAEGPASAMNVWTVDPPTAHPTRWTATTLGTVPPEALVEPELVHFTSFDGLTVPAFYYRPRGATGPLPVIINIHGGPEAQALPIFNPSTQYFVSQGYAVLAPNVRGSMGYGKTYGHLDDVRKRMDSVADIKAAHAWLVEHGGADPSRIAVMGGSYGGFMVLACLTSYPELWSAAIDIVGIANFVTFLENTSAYRRKVREYEYGSLEHDRDFLAEISPIHKVDRIAAPLMVVHGANDPRVPLDESDQIVESLRRREVPVEYLVYDDEGHGLAKLKNRLDAYPKMAAFLEQHMGAATA